MELWGRCSHCLRCYLSREADTHTHTPYTQKERERERRETPQPSPCLSPSSLPPVPALSKLIEKPGDSEAWEPYFPSMQSRGRTGQDVNLKENREMTQVLFAKLLFCEFTKNIIRIPARWLGRWRDGLKRDKENV